MIRFFSFLIFLSIILNFTCARPPRSGEYCEAMNSKNCLILDLKNLNLKQADKAFSLKKSSIVFYTYEENGKEHSIRFVNENRLLLKTEQEEKTFLRKKNKKKP
ncbi:MAG: hypothetical protein H7A25_03245 [Leptospiraceae bacterium]|nr:hypothetical protein [Leptospiraceae bacterium]MCP5498891.1 hypothetical protein [Leptospiraceae bacterium]